MILRLKFYSFTPCVFCIAGWCQDWVSGSGRSGSGFQKASAGLTWRIGMDGYTLKLVTCGWRCPLPSYSSLSVKSLKGQSIFHTVSLDIFSLIYVPGYFFKHLLPSMLCLSSLTPVFVPWMLPSLPFSPLVYPLIISFSYYIIVLQKAVYLFSQQLFDIPYAVAYFIICELHSRKWLIFYLIQLQCFCFQ